MGVAASMSISVIVDGELWGLIACHHYSPARAVDDRRIAAEIFGDFFSLAPAGAEAKAQARCRLARRADRSTGCCNSRRISPTSPTCCATILPTFDELMSSDGSRPFWINGTWHAARHRAPRRSDSRAGPLRQLSLRWQDLGHACAVPAALRSRRLLRPTCPACWLSRCRNGPARLSVFLPQGGDPDPELGRQSGKILRDRPARRPADPAQELCDLEGDGSKPGRALERRRPRDRRGGPRRAVEIVLRHNEIIADERSRADMRQRMLNEELNHRVKNILAVIKSLVGHPAQEGRDLADYVASLKGRIQALACAHDQVARGDGGGLLRDLLGRRARPVPGRRRDRARRPGVVARQPRLLGDGAGAARTRRPTPPNTARSRRAPAGSTSTGN